RPGLRGALAFASAWPLPPQVPHVRPLASESCRAHAPGARAVPLLARPRAMPPPVPLLALRFAPRVDGTWQDLATGGTALLIRRAATEVAAAAWPEQAARLWHLWHPHLASALDFGWITDDEWFDAYAIVPVTSSG